MTRPRTSSATIEAVLDDMASGRPMDRLVCGDVGFGKTEVALRAAFAAAINGKQVAVVVPTTLAGAPAFQEFRRRASRGCRSRSRRSRAWSRAGRAQDGQGRRCRRASRYRRRHPCLARQDDQVPAISASSIVDEEQHFGVKHKERLKELRAEVHVLTLTATPIPRTLQLALTGVRELSIIATPPVDRLAVRTFVSPFDPLLVREALLRERYRGGQIFYVCPRIEDFDEAERLPAPERAGGEVRRSPTARCRRPSWKT